jgi:hypothetical protein
MSDVVVTLSAEQLELAHRIGRRRNAQIKRWGKRERIDALIAKAMQSHEDGAAAELAVTLATGRAWTGVLPDSASFDDWRKFSSSHSDVEGLEVRATRHQGGSLILRDRDRKRCPYVLVILVGPRDFMLVGWIMLEDGKVDRYLRDAGGYGRPAHFIPQRALRDIEELFPVVDLVPAPRVCDWCARRVSVLLRVRFCMRLWWICVDCPEALRAT